MKIKLEPKVEWSVERNGVRYEALSEPFGKGEVTKFRATCLTNGRTHGTSKKLDSLMNRVRLRLERKSKFEASQKGA